MGMAWGLPNETRAFLTAYILGKGVMFCLELSYGAPYCTKSVLMLSLIEQKLPLVTPIFVLYWRIYGALICMYKILHNLLDFSCDATSSRLRGHQQRYKARRRQHACSVRIVLLRNKLPGDIVNASTVEVFKARFDARWHSMFTEVPL